MAATKAAYVTAAKLLSGVSYFTEMLRERCISFRRLQVRATPLRARGVVSSIPALGRVACQAV